MNSKPLVPICLLFIGGVLSGRFFGEAAFPILASLAVIMLAGALFQKLRVLSLSALILLSGFVVYTMRYAVVSPTDLRSLFAETEQILDVRGELLETPVVREYKNRNRIDHASSARLRVTAVKFDGEWKSANGEIVTTTRGIVPENFRAGHAVTINGLLRPPLAAPAEGLFDYRKYLYHQRIFYQLKVDSPLDWKPLGADGSIFSRLTDQFQQWAKATLARGLPEGEVLDLIWSMTLGWKTGLEGEVAESFMRTGTMHIFAISGLHVACIAGALLIALRYAGLSRQHCGWIAIPLLWFYTLVTGWQPSAVRSAIMSTVLIAGWGLKRPTDLLNSTAAGALLILAFEPEQLFQASFQLSFAVVTSMALFIPPMEELRRKVLAPDSFLPPELRPRWQRALDAPVRFVTINLVVSIASWLGSLAVVAWYFNIVTPVSLLANLIAVPLSSVALICSLLSLVLSPLAPVFNFLSWAFMSHTSTLTRYLAGFSFGYFYVAKPALLFFLLFYTALLVLMTGLLKNTHTRKWAIALPVLLGACWLGQKFFERDAVQLAVLPVNGTPIFANFPGFSHDLLVDCSNERDSEYVLKRFLRAQGVGAVANVVVTHGDINHVGGYHVVWKEFVPHRIFTSTARARSSKYREMIQELESGSVNWRRISRGDELAGWRVLHPSEKHFARADDNSIVLRREIHGRRILLLSDLGRLGQRDLAQSPLDLTADILIAGMPDRDEPLEPELLERIRPKLVILGNNQSAVNRAAEARILKRLRQSGAAVLCTWRTEAVTLTFRESICQVQTQSGRKLSFSGRPIAKAPF